MKSFIFATLALLSVNLFAAIPSDLEKVGFISGSVIAADPLCPTGVQCVTNGTKLSLEFTMGCLDQFGDYDYRTTDNGLVVAMIGMVSSKSKAVRCIRANTKVIEISVPNLYPPFEIQFMGRSETVPVSDFTRQ
jgi:hypothetical protein